MLNLCIEARSGGVLRVLTFFCTHSIMYNAFHVLKRCFTVEIRGMDFMGKKLLKEDFLSAQF